MNRARRTWQNVPAGRRAYFLLLLLAATPLQAAGQLSVGVLGGYSLTTFTGSGAIDVVYRGGFLAGVTGTLAVSESFSIRPELYVSTKGSNVLINDETRADTTDFGLTYVQLPVLFQLHTAPGGRVRPHLFGGLSLGVPLTCSLGPVQCADLPDFERQVVDMGVVVGAEIEVSGVGVGARYEVGVGSINRHAIASEISTNEISNSVVSFTVRYLRTIWGGSG